jgi:hypothetical protein
MLIPGTDLAKENLIWQFPTGIHHEQMQKLRSLYQFGKWVDLQETEHGASFKGRRIRQKIAAFVWTCESL